MKYVFAFLTLLLVCLGGINIFYKVFDYSSADFLLLTLVCASFTKLAE